MAFGSRYTLAEHQRWLTVFFRRFFNNQFKRSCTADGPKVGGCTVAAGDWRMPSDAQVRSCLLTSSSTESLETIVTQLTLTHARVIVRATLATGREELMLLTVAVLDAGGHLVALEREDGSGIMRVEIAVGKAYGALGFGQGRTMRDRPPTGPICERSAPPQAVALFRCLVACLFASMI